MYSFELLLVEVFLADFGAGGPHFKSLEDAAAEALDCFRPSLVLE